MHVAVLNMNAVQLQLVSRMQGCPRHAGFTHASSYFCHMDSWTLQLHRVKGVAIHNQAVAALQVDVIVSEWMGYGLLFESMLDTVLYARDRSALAVACCNILHIQKLEVPCSDNVNYMGLNLLADISFSFDCTPITS